LLKRLHKRNQEGEPYQTSLTTEGASPERNEKPPVRPTWGMLVNGRKKTAEVGRSISSSQIPKTNTINKTDGKSPNRSIQRSEEKWGETQKQKEKRRCDKGEIQGGGGTAALPRGKRKRMTMSQQRTGEENW